MCFPEQTEITKQHKQSFLCSEDLVFTAEYELHENHTADVELCFSQVEYKRFSLILSYKFS